MTELVNGRIPKTFTVAGLSSAVQTLQWEMMDVQRVMSPQYLKEIEPAFNALVKKVEALDRDVRRVESKLGHAQKAAERAEQMARGVDRLGKYIEGIHNAFAEEVLTRLDAIEGRFKKHAESEAVSAALRDMEAEYDYAIKYGDGSAPWAPPKPKRQYTGPGWLTMADEAKKEPEPPAPPRFNGTIGRIEKDARTQLDTFSPPQQWVLAWDETKPEPPKPAPVTEAEYRAACKVIEEYVTARVGA